MRRTSAARRSARLADAIPSFFRQGLEGSIRKKTENMTNIYCEWGDLNFCPAFEVETASAEFDSFAASVPSPQRLVFFWQFLARWM